MPLKEDFIPTIKSFILQLRSLRFIVKENPLSTQVYGDYDKVMQLVTSEVKEAFQNIDNGLLQMKIVKTDRSDYEPNF